jgi:hypothetical protein
MSKIRNFLLSLFVITLMLLIVGASDSFAQGKGKGKSKSAAAKTKKPNDKGKSAGKVNSSKNNKNIDKDREERERRINKKLPKDNELNRFRGIAKKLGTSPEGLRARYRKELYRNPDLKFGNFVSAHVVADNLAGKNPRITSGAILDRMGDGMNLGQALKDLGVNKRDRKEAKNRAKREIEKSKKNREKIY